MASYAQREHCTGGCACVRQVAEQSVRLPMAKVRIDGQPGELHTEVAVSKNLPASYRFRYQIGQTTG